MSEAGEYDPRKALGEEIAGLFNILSTLTAQVRQAEMRASEAATHYDNLIKLKAFADQEIARKRKVLRKLLDENSNIDR